MCLFFWGLIAALFALILFVARLHVWQTSSAKHATAQQTERIRLRNEQD
jgi:hypothetical protein